MAKKRSRKLDPLRQALYDRMLDDVASRLVKNPALLQRLRDEVVDELRERLTRIKSKKL